MKRDRDYTNSIVPKDDRRSTITMSMIMIGFTFCSSSMWVGQKLADGSSLVEFISSLILGGLILAGYAGVLGYVGAETGMGLDLLAKKALGEKGSYLVSFVISITQIGWFGVGIAMFALPVSDVIFGNNDIARWGLTIVAGIFMTSSAYFGIKALTIVSYIAVPTIAILGSVATYMAVSKGELSLIEQFSQNDGSLSILSGIALVVGSFISGGTTTPNFTRYSTNGKSALYITILAFLFGNALMFIFGGVASAYIGGNDIFQVMVKLNMFYLAILVLGLNIWTTNDNSLYSAGLGLANILKKKKKPLILISGILGTLISKWLYSNFCDWLIMLNSLLPPCGVVLILAYFLNKKDFINISEKGVNWIAVIGIIVGTLSSMFFKQGLPAINSMIVTSVIYLFCMHFKVSRNPR